MFDSKNVAFCLSCVRSTVMSSWTHHFACSVITRSVAVIRRFFFAAKSYVQNGFDVPTSSTGGVVRTGVNSFAGWPSRPRIARVSANTSATGSGLFSRACVMSGSAAVPLPTGVSVVEALADALGEADGAVVGGVHATARAKRIASDRLTNGRTRRRGSALRRPAHPGDSDAVRAG